MKTSLCPVWSRVEDKSEGVMYGLLLESVQYYVIQDVGEEMWKKILEHAGFNKNMVFTTHDTYRDEMMTSLAKSCVHVTKSKDFNQWMTFFGTCFVEFCTTYGYDKLLGVAGRYYRDFLHGIDNIHEVIRFSYPRLQSPAFLVLTEDKDGCVMLYQSKRRGFKHYVIGQLQQIAKRFYSVAVTISVIEEEIIDRKCHVKFRLDFDNSAYVPKIKAKQTSGIHTFSSISGDTFLKVFPFCIVFNSHLVIKMVGNSMLALLKDDNLIGARFRDKFHIRRPLIPCIWSKIMQFRRVIFEVEYLLADEPSDLDIDHEVIEDAESDSNTDHRVLLRGQMKYLEDWNMIAFLCTPLLCNLNDLRRAGLYINDLNLFDMSRDMVMAGWQHASQLERSIEEQRKKCEKITENMTKFEEWQQKSDSLLYNMIPESVAGKLKSGEDYIATCERLKSIAKEEIVKLSVVCCLSETMGIAHREKRQNQCEGLGTEVFDNVTIMFNYMVGFGEVCSSATPMEIVEIINSVFSLFDQIIDSYDVFKVETLGDAVYMVAGGVPDRNPNHAINVAGLALELQTKAKTLTEPMSEGYKLNTRIGMHTGSVVGGVVGRRMPQYCLFGDTVNTASRMQTYSMPGRIHISEPCQECLKGTSFVTVVRGTVNVKGKGEMRTFWLAGREGEESTKQFCEEIKQERSQSVRKYSSYENAMDLHAMHASTSYAQMPANFGGLKSNRSSSTISLAQQSDDESTPDMRLGEKFGMKGSPRSSLNKLNEYRRKSQDIAEENESKSSFSVEGSSNQLNVDNEGKHDLGFKLGFDSIINNNITQCQNEQFKEPDSDSSIENKFNIPKIIENDSIVVHGNETNVQKPNNNDARRPRLTLRRIKLSLPKLPDLSFFKSASARHNSSSDEIRIKTDVCGSDQATIISVDKDESTETERTRINVFLGSEEGLTDLDTESIENCDTNNSDRSNISKPPRNTSSGFDLGDDNVFDDLTSEISAINKTRVVSSEALGVESPLELHSGIVKSTNKSETDFENDAKTERTRIETKRITNSSKEICSQDTESRRESQSETKLVNHVQVSVSIGAENANARQSHSNTNQYTFNQHKSASKRVDGYHSGQSDRKENLIESFRCPFSSLWENKFRDVNDLNSKHKDESESSGVPSRSCNQSPEHLENQQNAMKQNLGKRLTEVNDKCVNNTEINGSDGTVSEIATFEGCINHIELDKLSLLERGIKIAWGLTDNSSVMTNGSIPDSKSNRSIPSAMHQTKNHVQNFQDSKSVQCIKCAQCECNSEATINGKCNSGTRLSRCSTESDIYDNNNKVVFMISDDESEDSR